ncbi:MAG: glycosyltransferase family 2 protein [Fervidobacterium sp.]|nr:glycosyltransferase family 2 protein [Fervidobacterium sp.]
MKNNKPFLSVAMIVKDEENNLPRCLESLKDFVDEIVIVDTGSVDRTVEIAKKYTDKVYFYLWNNDFSAARNYSLQFPTGEWVFIVDADEEATPEMKEGLRNYLEGLPSDVNTVYLPTISYLDWNFEMKEVASSARVFRNGTVKFENIVHNQAIYKPKVSYAPFSLIHYGYIWTRKLKQKKYARTANLIREHLKQAENIGEKIYYLVQLYKTETVSPHFWSHVRVGWEVANLLTKTQNIPTIALEFMYIFGMELISNQIKEGEKLLDACLRLSPEYPDPYCGFAIKYFNDRNYEKAFEFAKDYFKVLDAVMAEKEKFTWTINSLKERDKLAGIMVTTALEMDEKEYVDKYLDEFFAIKDLNLKATFFGAIISVFSKKTKEFFAKYNYVFEKVLEEALSNRIIFPMGELLMNLLKNTVELSERAVLLLKGFPVANKLEFWLREKIAKPDNDFIYSYFLSDTPEDKFLDEHGIPGLIFLYYLKKDYYEPEKIIKWLHDLTKKTENALFKGLIEALIGDTYLRLKNVKNALNYYKKAATNNPLISKFIKPIIEDLKTSLLDLDIEGVADDLWKYYVSNNDFIISLNSYPKSELENVYLLSNHDFARYVSAINSSDNDKKIDLLMQVSRPNLFKNYYYHLAKAFEKKDLETAYVYHIKAIEENEVLADIKEKNYRYTELYPAHLPSYYRADDLKVWVGNLSERFSCRGIIQPVRTWKISKEGFYYSIPLPTEDAISIFLKREFDALGKNNMLVSGEFLQSMVSKLEFDDVRLIYDVDKANFDLSVFSRLGIKISEKSQNFVILSGFERSYDVGNLLSNAKSALIFTALPNVENRDDDVWYYPGFTILRDYKQISNLMNKLRFKIIYKEIQNNFVGILVEKVEKTK